jgi:N-acetylmuramoyl-L-alanine amidase
MAHQIKYIVVHCSDSEFGNAALIAKWHIQKKWDGIGYHEVILNGKISSDITNFAMDGHLETGRPLDQDSLISGSEIGAHVQGFNEGSIGICLIGKSGKFTSAQKKTLMQRLKMHKLRNPEAAVVGHCDLDPIHKAFCPGFDVKSFYELNK